MMRGTTLSVCLCFALAGCGDDGDRDSAAASDDGGEEPRKIETVREAAVAGLFYPGEKGALSKLVDDLLAGARGGSPKNLRALICPHAGYSFSGKTAAIAYKQAAGGHFRTVIVLAPSHTAAFKGASVPPVDAYRTPLGLVPLSRKADQLATVAPFTREPHSRASRPPWWTRSPKKVSPFSEDTPHTWEHSLEVQLPFLQKVLAKAVIVPAVLGDVDAKAAANALGPFIGDDTLLVVSSDLSHYHPYAEAQKLDKATIADILRLDADALTGAGACGYQPIRTLLHLAKARGWQGRLLDYRNSGDTSGEMSRVVGYAAIAFYQGPAPEAPAAARASTGPAAVYSPEQRTFLLDLARKTLIEVVRTGSPPAVDAADVPWALRGPKGCFVTLTRRGRLRGCIGSIFPREPLFATVVDMTRNAALKDTRFTPVAAAELGEIDIEISVLTVPGPLTFSSPEDLLAGLRPGVDGVIFRMGGRQSTYLPQVWQQIPDKATFMGNLARKAGLAPSAWREKGASVLTYQAEAFHQAAPPPAN